MNQRVNKVECANGPWRKWEASESNITYRVAERGDFTDCSKEDADAHECEKLQKYKWLNMQVSIVSHRINPKPGVKKQMSFVASLHISKALGTRRE